MTGAAVAGATSLWQAPTKAEAEVEPDVFEPARGSLTGKTVLVTGATTGLGLETATRLAAAGATVVVTGRSRDKAERAAAAVRSAAAKTNDKVPQVRAVELELASLESIRTLPERLRDGPGSAQPGYGIDVLVNNAGVMALPEHAVTLDGFERQIGVNFLGHFALVAAVLPALRQRPKFRIVNVSSAAQNGANSKSLRTAIDSKFDPPEYSAWGNYAASKALNVAFSTELQRRFDAAGLAASAVSLHPGVVQTDLARYVIGGNDATEPTQTAAQFESMNPVQQFGMRLVQKILLPVPVGANTQVYLAAACDSDGDLAAHGALYYDNMKVAKPVSAAVDAALARDAFLAAERATDVHYPI